jgi:ankyrin repeat protein
MEFAIERGHKNIVKILLDAGANVNNKSWRTNVTPLWRAVCKGNKDMVQLLLDHGASVNIGVQVHGMHMTPLREAANIGNEAIVKLLLGAGAETEPDRTLCSGPSALHMAVIRNSGTIVKLLAEAGADVNRNYYSGQSPL